MRVRKMRENDFPSVAAIFYKVFERHEDDAFANAWLKFNPTLSLVAEEKDVLGFLLVTGTHIEFLGVSPDAQGKGVGTTLLHSLLDKCKRRLVNVTLVPSNNSPMLISWYIRHGFIPLRYKQGVKGEELWMECIQNTP